MYSYEDRIRAVKLFIKLGKRTGPTIRQLGFPTKNALKSWCREYERSRDLQVVNVRSRQKYSDERKQAAVQHYLDHDASTIRALGYPCRDLLTERIDKLHPEVRHRIVGRAPNIQQPFERKNAAVIEMCTRTTRALEIADRLVAALKHSYSLAELLAERGSDCLTNMLTRGSPLPMSFRAITAAMATGGCERRWVDAIYACQKKSSKA